MPSPRPPTCDDSPSGGTWGDQIPCAAWINRPEKATRCRWARIVATPGQALPSVARRPLAATAASSSRCGPAPPRSDQASLRYPFGTSTRARSVDPSCRSSSREHQAEHRVHVPTRRRRRCTQPAGLDQCPVDIPEQDPAHHSATVPVATGAEERSLSPYAGTEPPQRKASSPGPSREGRTCRRLATKRTRSMVLPLISVPLPLDQSRSVATKRCPR